MPAGAVLATSVMVPFVCLGMLLWLAWLEDTLVEDVKKSSRRSTPQPIVSVPATSKAPVRPAPAAARGEGKADEDPTFPVAIAS